MERLGESYVLRWICWNPAHTVADAIVTPACINAALNVTSVEVA